MTNQLLGYRCSGCRSPHVTTVLDLGRAPAGDHFPPASEPISLTEGAHPLAMMLCTRCGLAQLQDDDTEPEQPLGIEPEALRNQARAAVAAVQADGWLSAATNPAGAKYGGTVAEFPSPHGGSWLPLITDLGFTPAEPDASASVVIDSFGIMHERDQHAAFKARAARTAADGTLLVQFHSLEAIVSQHQWTALRHGHFAYYSTSSLSRLLAEVDMYVADVWEFDLYGGTVLAAARHRKARHPGHCSIEGTQKVARILDRERAMGISDPLTVNRLQQDATRETDGLRHWLAGLHSSGSRVYAYGAASRAVALFSRAGIDRGLVLGVADASPAKQGRRMPGTDIPVISPEELVDVDPHAIWLTLPDLLPEVRRRYPTLAGRWQSPPMS